MQNRIRGSVTILSCVAIATTLLSAQGRGRRPLAAGDVDAITRLVMLEDTRAFDPEELGRLIASAHPEVRRRAVLAVGRIADARGNALLAGNRSQADPEVAATVVFSTGQLKDPAAIPWLAELLAGATTPAPVSFEAATALGKYQVPEARAALAGFLSKATLSRSSGPTIGAALLSIGRFPKQDDLTPVTRWATAPDAAIRWRAAWALVRQRDPAAVPHLLKLSADPSPEVRFWAVRGLVPHPGTDAAPSAARLRELVKDPDRQVRTEALRALTQHNDDESFAIVLKSLESPDTWLSVSAAEAIARVPSRAAAVVPRLVAASAATRPLSLRLTILTPLATLAPEAAVDLAAALAREPGMVPRTSARQALTRLGEPGKARLDALIEAGVIPRPAAPTPRTISRKPLVPRPEAEYRRIVERWILPDYNGRPRPRAIWETARGTIELELYPGVAPLGVDHFVRVVESGEIVGTEFGRVVPNFVAQQRAIRDDVTLRDEVSRIGLPRGNLSWASAGLDTGRPGYTLGVTPQPHNEGNFTALGRVVSGMEAVERLELGDAITAARMRR